MYHNIIQYGIWINYVDSITEGKPGKSRHKSYVIIII